MAPLINFSGIASGIDSESLISATSDVTRAVRIKPYEKKIADLEDTNDALSQLKQKLASLKSIVADFATLAGGPLTKLAASSDETIVSASASNSASNGTYSLSVSTLAKNATYSLASTAGLYSSADAVISSGAPFSDTVTVTIGSPTVVQTINLTVTETTTLSEFVNSFNNSTTRATASVVNVGTSTPDYRVVFNTNKTGTAEGAIAVTPGAVLTARNAFNSPSSSAATNASFTISGISGAISRASNSVSDVIPGVTFNLKAVNTPNTITVTISDDAEATATKAQEYVDGFNDVVSFIQENNLIIRDEDGEDVINIFGPLALTSVDNNSITTIRSSMGASVYYNSGVASSSTNEIRIFADLGITTDSGAYNAETKTGGGTLKFDKTVFKNAISEESLSVNQIMKNFGDRAGLTGGTIDNFTRFGGLLETSINANKELISDLNDRIATAEAAILKQEELMRQRFSRLESLIGKLQNQQSALSSAISSLPRLR